MAYSRREAFGALAATALWPGHALADPEPPLVGTSVVTAPDEDPETSLDTTGDPYSTMVAPVGVNGQGPYPFLIDTGANVSCVSRRLAEHLELTPAPPARVHSVIGVQTRPAVMIHELQVGRRNRRRVRAPALPLKSDQLGGVLGVDWLKGQRLVLNIKEKRLEITFSRNDPPRLNSVVVPARQRWGQLTIVDADVSYRPIQALIDSGSQITMCNDPLRRLVARIDPTQGLQRKPSPVRLETIMGEPFIGDLIYLPFLRLGGLRLGNVPVVHANTHVFRVWGVEEKPALVIGMDLLSEFSTVALDFGKASVRFDL
ncbi:aspartyl protease family protein [Phenylobacterium deserti]|uniref:Peptidase A2 domain-containing protein n=1 Tax=Phenylobacterium deserti TaxID=1914756 RepID=A0A328AC21_9CAUL|nr:aspartyl protease family protein [Phenylobacterium deserti]RAK52027.1 hypothetical protein DJ018_12755 [Phenylobacterium deserti]